MSRSSANTLLRAWPFAALVLLTAVFVLMLTFSRKAPVIASLEPDMASPGQQVVIKGDYFGRTEREGSLSLAGEIPPPSLIQSWTDQRIVFVVPEDASSGLVTVSNSQGTSTGVLFTNTESIPTVLQPAGPLGAPLLASAVPPRPQAGQIVTLTGRGFGSGETAAWVRIAAGPGKPVFSLTPSDCVFWSERQLSFRWPSGAGAGSSVQVVTPGGSSPPLALEASSPVVWEDPRTLKVEIRASVSPVSGAAVVWGPVPQRLSGTAWVLESAQPAPANGAGPLVFRWPAGAAGERKAVYQLALTAWARRWEGFPAGTAAAEAPGSDPRPAAWWRPAQPALKALTARWGLEISDPWLRAQRIHTGLKGAFQFETGGSVLGMERTPAQILASAALAPLEAAGLAAYLAVQAGVPSRLVSGLWLDSSGTPVSRVWCELWFAGAGWVPWDPAEGPPGTLDNRHFAFSVQAALPVRLEPGAGILGRPLGFGLGEPAGEAVWTGQEPVVQWEIRRDK